MQYFCILSFRPASEFTAEQKLSFRHCCSRVTLAKQAWSSNCRLAYLLRNIGGQPACDFFLQSNSKVAGFHVSEAPSGVWCYMTLSETQPFKKLIPRLLLTFCRAFPRKVELNVHCKDTQVTLCKSCVIFFNKLGLEYLHLNIPTSVFWHLKTSHITANVRLAFSVRSRFTSRPKSKYHYSVCSNHH